MNLSDFKILKEDAENYHLEHPSGKRMSVSKALLSGSAKKAIEKMCSGGEVQKFDDGGTVQPPAALAAEPVADAPAAAPVAEVPSSIAAPVAEAPVAAAPVAPGGASGSWEPAPPAAAAIPPPAPTSTDPLIAKGLSTDQLLTKEQGDISDLAKSQVGEAGAATKAYSDYNKAMADRMTPDQLMQSYKSKDDALMKSYLDHKIDPNSYVNHMSTPSKISAGISMIFGGLAQGLIGGKNPGMEWLQNSINQDIESQKNEQGKSYNLWKMNRDAMGDDMRANMATQNQMWTGVQAKIAQAAAAAQAPAAKFRAQQAINDIEKQKIQNRQTLGLLSQGSNGGYSNANPLDLVNSMVPEAQRKDVAKEIGQAQSAVKIEGNLKGLFDQAKEDARPATGMSMTSLLNTVPGYHPQSVNNLVALFDPLIHDNEGRINELEQQHIQALIPKFGDSDERVEQKWKGLTEFINHKKEAPLAKTNGIDINRFSSTTDNPMARLNPRDQMAVQWAKANPRDPMSMKILKANGM